MGKNNELHALAILADTFSGMYQAGVASKTKLKIAEYDQKARDDANQAKILEYLIDRSQKDIDKTIGQIDEYSKIYQQSTGDIYKMDSLNQSGNAINVLDNLTGKTLDNLGMIAEATKQERNAYRSGLNDLQKDIVNIGLVQDFYKGMGHSYEGGIDPSKWDTEDFSDENLKAYMSKFKELEGVESEPFMEGLLARQQAGVTTIIGTLNEGLQKQNLNDLKVKTQNLALKTSEGKLEEKDYNDIIGNINKVIGPDVRNLYSQIVEPIATGLASGVDDDVEKANTRLIDIGKIVDRGLKIKDDDGFLSLGTKIVKAISNYKGSTDKNFGKNSEAYFDMISELHNYITFYGQARDENKVTETEYNDYINNIEFLTGPIETFMETFPILEEAKKNLDDQALSLLISNTVQDANQSSAANAPPSSPSSVISPTVITTPTVTPTPVVTPTITNPTVIDPNATAATTSGQDYEDFLSAFTQDPDDEAITSLTLLGAINAAKDRDNNLLAGNLGIKPSADNILAGFLGLGKGEQFKGVVDDELLNELATEPGMDQLPGGMKRLTKYYDDPGSIMQGLRIDSDKVNNMSDIRDAQDELMNIANNVKSEIAGFEDKDLEEFIKEEFEKYIKSSNIVVKDTPKTKDLSKFLEPEDYKYFIGKRVDKDNKVNKIEDMNLYRLYPDWAFKGNKGNVRWITADWGFDSNTGQEWGGYTIYARVMDEFRQHLINKVT